MTDEVAAVPESTPVADVSAIHTLLDEALTSVRSFFDGHVPEKIAQFEHFITGAHGALDQVADSASKE